MSLNVCLVQVEFLSFSFYNFENGSLELGVLT